MHLKALNCVSANSKNVIKTPEELTEHGKEKFTGIVKTNIVTLRYDLCYVCYFCAGTYGATQW